MSEQQVEAGNRNEGTRRSTRNKRRRGSVEIKVYLVFVPNNVAKPGEPNRRLIAQKLSRSAAQEIVDTMPGAYIIKVYATK